MCEPSSPSRERTRVSRVHSGSISDVDALTYDCKTKSDLEDDEKHTRAMFRK